MDAPRDNPDDTGREKAMDGLNSMEGAAASCITRETFDGLRDVIGDNGLAGLIAMYQDESEKMIADIVAAIAADDLYALGRHIHVLKGVSSNFGLDRIVSTANATMAACRQGRRNDAYALAAALPSLTREGQTALNKIAATLR